MHPRGIRATLTFNVAAVAHGLWWHVSFLHHQQILPCLPSMLPSPLREAGCRGNLGFPCLTLLMPGIPFPLQAEDRLGPIGYLRLTFVFLVASIAMQISVHAILARTRFGERTQNTIGVGFSCVVFAWMTWASLHERGATLNLIFFEIPFSVSPFASLFVTQVTRALPHVSACAPSRVCIKRSRSDAAAVLSISFMHPWLSHAGLLVGL